MLDTLWELHQNGELLPLLGDAYQYAVDRVREDYLPLYTSIITAAITVELVLVGVLVWWAARSDRLTSKWRRRLLAALPVAVLFGAVRLMLDPSVLGGSWLAGVGVAWWLVFTRIPAQGPEAADA